MPTEKQHREQPSNDPYAQTRVKGDEIFHKQGLLCSGLFFVFANEVRNSHNGAFLMNQNTQNQAIIFLVFILLIHIFQ